MSYKLDMQINYGNNEQYRIQFRELCNMQSTFDPSLNDLELDEETLDEQDFDMAAASKTMDYIWGLTKYNPLFKAIYRMAAAIMISENEEIGLAIMISYDYLDVFHACFCEFMRNPANFDEKNATYLAVLERFTKLGYNRK
jgi:hypothetical protein